MASVNKVILLGRLGRDPETRTTQGGMTICRLAVATDRRWKDQSGEKQQETEWHNVSIFGKQAEIADQYLKKGSEVYIEGRLKTRKYQDKEGIERWSTDIICESMQLGARPEGSQRQEEQPAQNYSAEYRERPSRQQAQRQSQPVKPDEDIPF